MNDSENDRKREWRVSPIFVIAAMIFTFVFVGAISGGSHIGKAGRRRLAATQIESLCGALDMLKNENGYYPSGTNALNDLMVKPTGAANWHQYYESRDGKIPLDPWGHPYLYEFPGKHRTDSYDISSAGPDGKFGTKDDIVNWDMPH